MASRRADDAYSSMEVYLKSLSSLASLCVAATLVACGGGGSDSGGNGGGNNLGGGAPGVSLLNNTPQVIEYHGDSTIWGYQSETTGEQVPEQFRAPTVFANAIREHHEVRNMGLNQTTACDLLEGTRGYEQPWAQYMADSDATVVIINHGINDIGAYDVIQYRRCLNQLVDIAQAESKVVILETPNPIGDSRIDEYVAAMRDVADAQGVDLIDQYANLIDEFTANPREVCPDGTHPSEAIYAEKGRYAASQFVTFESPR